MTDKELIAEACRLLEPISLELRRGSKWYRLLWELGDALDAHQWQDSISQPKDAAVEVRLFGDRMMWRRIPDPPEPKT